MNYVSEDFQFSFGSSELCSNASVIDEYLPLAVLFQLGDIQSHWHFLAFWMPCRLKGQVEFADNKPVVCSAVCTAHSLCHSVCPSFALDIVIEMPVFGTRVDP